MIKIFTVFMSLQLILAPVAIAQTAGDQFRENPDSKKSSSYIDQIGSIAISAVGTSALLSCKFGTLLTSVVLFNAGSIAYIASEIMGGKAQNAFQNKKVADMKMVEEKMKKGVNGGDIQKEALETALADEKETLSIINKRKKWLTAIAAIYSLATIAALLEVIKMPIPFIQPPMQFAACEPGSAIVGSMAIKAAVVAAWSFVSLKQDGMLGKYGSMAAALGVAFTGIGTTIVTMLNSPPTRVAAFGIAAALVMKNQSDLSAQATVAKENIEKLEKVLAEFKNATGTNNSTINQDLASSEATGGAGSSAGVAGGGQSSGGLSGRGSTTIGNPNDIRSLSDTRPGADPYCFSQNNRAIDYEQNCSNPLRLNQPRFDAEINVPTLQNGTRSAVEFANAVTRGDIAAADASAGQLESLSGKLKDLEKNFRKRANESLVANKKDPIDFEKNEKDALQKIQDAFVSQAKKDNFNLASLGSSTLSTTNQSESSNDDSDSDSSKNGSSSASGTTNNQAAYQGLGAITEGSLSNSDFSEISEGDLTASKSLEDSLNDYETSVNDISNRSEDSIFKQVSMRYRANYDRFFDRKKPRPESE